MELEDIDTIIDVPAMTEEILGIVQGIETVEERWEEVGN